MNAKKLISKNALIYFLLVISAFLGGTLLASNDNSKINNSSETKTFQNQASENRTSAFNIDFTNAAERSVNAVVHVKIKALVKQNQNKLANDPFFEFFFGQARSQPKEQTVISSGSGVIITSDGYIITNFHVINHAEDIEIVLNDKREFAAKIIGKDPNTDLALLKIDAVNLASLPLGNSDNLKIGEWVLAVGNPFNLTSTVTAGIVSAKARNINILDTDMKIESFIQTDAAVNPGNSGGALVNTKGELIGINTAIASQTGSYSGYSFAIPSSIVSKVISDLKEYGEVQRAVLGISITDINEDIAKEKKIETMEGAYIQFTTDGGAAKLAGIKEGDIIIQIDGIKIKSATELQEQVARHNPGDEVKITIVRDGKEQIIDVELQNRKGNTDRIKSIELKD